MAKKMNCWEYKKCGREPGGVNEGVWGVCPASCECLLDGVNGGANAGRASWVVAGTLCEGSPQGAFAEKISTCLECDFYLKVKAEEGDQYVSTEEIRKKLRDK